jgi:vitamin B12 transporter
MKSIDSAFRFAVLLLLAVFVLPAFAQAQSNDVHLSGSLTDSSGAALSGVRVTAQPDLAAAAQPVSAISDHDGRYDLQLAAGKYRVQFVFDSFAKRQFAVDLAAGTTRTLDVRLTLEPLSSSVVVTAQSVPASVQQTTAPTDIFTRGDIEERQSVTLPDLLFTSPGVAIGRTGINGGTASLFLNGGNSSYTKVLVDGSPINPPGSAVDFSNLTFDNIDKVEIVRGAESAIYGSDAVSGVVQLFSHRGSTRIPAGSVFAEGGSFSSARGGGQLSGLLSKFDYSGASSYLQTSGEYPNSDFINRNLSGNFGYSFSDTNQLHLSLVNNTGSAGIPGQILFLPPSLHQRYDQRVFSANARWEFQSGSHWHHQIMGTESYTRQHSFNSEQSYYATDPQAFCPQANSASVATMEFCDFTYEDVLKYNRTGFDAQSSYIARNFAATAGVQYEVENGEVSYITPGHLRRNNIDGYLDFRYSPISRFTLNAGLRAEDNANFGTRVSPRAGGTVALHYGQGFWGDTRYHAFYGQGIKEPRFDQTFGTNSCYPGNPNLRPEESKNWTTGFDQMLASNRLKLSADYFYSRFYDVVSFAYNAPPNPNFCGTYFNTDLAFARGFNFATELRVSKRVQVFGNYTYDDTRVLKSVNPNFDPALQAGSRLIRRPVNSGSFGVNVSYARINWNFISYFSGVRTDSNFLNPGQTNNPGYARFDISASYALARGVSLTARATNLFDKQYQDALGYPALGRDYRFGVRYQFPGRN